MITALNHTSIRLAGVIFIVLGAGLAAIFSFMGTILGAIGRNRLPQPVRNWLDDSPLELWEHDRGAGHREEWGLPLIEDNGG